ncbi:putative ornithine decarboxylase [Leptomonas pyrrhocoris]|uniref:ornithine decarboxylase n=1 Tax=Leptomonas pyrrhocoris TaxID=157538 RepID=A0A0M9FTN8_LEPPY|nr:putative ornithine decarboxylase [Leptomonas pyrrhocoris]KPA75803.1 putative ornithine decarboxylase [Leptomonas pyrrhocoris]|eukprot:XP_015654242.1 putative ornithine decarboxylase [Leptomonas pyrrhocoris]
MSNHDVALSNANHYNNVNYTELVPLSTIAQIHPAHTNSDVTVTQDGVTVTTTVSATALMTPTAATPAAPVPPSAFDDAAQQRLLARKTALLEKYHMCPQSADRVAQQRRQHEVSHLRDREGSDVVVPPPSAVSPTDCNKNSSNYTGAVSVAGSPISPTDPTASCRGPVAASQDLVDLFFLEGSDAVNGMNFSAYPIYGERTAAQRREAVRAVLEKYGVELQLPASPATPAAAAHRQRRPPHAVVSRDGVETREQYWRRLASVYIRRGITAAATAAAAATRPAYEPEDPFYVIDLGRVVEQMARWRHELPMVRPHFAVKCNPNVAIMEVLGVLGAGFDCASKDEIHVVLDNHLVASADDIIFANPCKQLGDLREAHACGVTYVTVDNIAEMEKIGRVMPSARAVIRIKTNDAAAKCAFSSKFGAGLDEVEGLLQAARQFNVEVYGVSFHVGSGNGDQSAYVSAVRDAHRVFQMAAGYGFNCTLLDIGGGYPGTEPQPGGGETSFETIARAMRPVLEELFGGGDVTIISEPGRYFTAATHALAMNVFAARKVRLSDAEKESCKAFQNVVNMDEPEEYQYYVNDGLYHSFNCIVFDHAHPTLLLLNDGDGADAEERSEDAAAGNASADDDAIGEVTVDGVPANDSLFTSAWDRRHNLPRRPLRLTTIFGPTCDSMDCILKKQPFPEMKLGDWLLAPDMGSYTTAAGCPFNGFSTRRREWVSSVTM